MLSKFQGRIISSRKALETDAINRYDGKVQLLFVNDDELYYKGSMTLDCNRFLWLYFHENHEIKFDCVYFLKFFRNQITVNEYGDIRGKRFVREGILTKNLCVASRNEPDIVKTPTAKEFYSMLVEYNKSGSGIIISIEDFIAMLSAKELKVIFQDFIKNRRGLAKIVLLLSDSNECSLNNELLKPYLSERIKHQVSHFKNTGFECIRDALYDDGTDNCIFLDRITADDAKNIVLSAVIRKKDKFNANSDIYSLINYLTIITDENVPKDNSLCLAHKIKSRKECYDYISRTQGWKELTKNCTRISLNSLLLMDISEALLKQKNKYTYHIVSDDVNEYRKNISDNYVLGIEPCIYYPLISLNNELHNSSLANDLDTKTVIISAMRGFSYFTHYIGELSLSNKKFISRDLFDSYMACIKISKNITHDLQAVNNGAPESLKSTIRKKEDDLKYRIDSLGKSIESIIKNPGRKPQLEPDIYDI